MCSAGNGPAVVQLTKGGIVVSHAPDQVAALRAEFDAWHTIRLPRFLNPELLTLIQERLSRGPFYTRTHGRVGVELCLGPDITYGILHYLMNNNPPLFRFVEAVTGCPPIGRFWGRIYRMVPGAEHYDSWHSDVTGDRLVAMSLNLSPEVFQGGVFQLREISSDRILREMPNTGYGDAILFRIAPNLVHRITAMEGATPKTAYAGWFLVPERPGI